MSNRSPAPSAGVERMRPRRLASAAPLVSERQNAAWGPRRACTGRPEPFGRDATSHFGLGQHLFQLGHVLVPLDEAGDGTETPDHTAVEVPDRGNHGPVVRIEEV